MSNLSNNIKGEERSTIKIDAQHVYMIAKYGPVVKYQDGETTKFKSAKRDLDLDKLKRGGVYIGGSSRAKKGDYEYKFRKT